MVTLCINIFISNWKRDCHNYCQLKKYSQPEVESYVYLVGIFRTSSLGDSISSKPERTAPRRWAEEPGCIEVLQQSAGSQNIKRLLLIKENQISQVKKFSAFLCMERCKSLGFLQSFLWYAPQLSGASILFSHSESFQGSSAHL